MKAIDELPFVAIFVDQGINTSRLCRSRHGVAQLACCNHEDFLEPWNEVCA